MRRGLVCLVVWLVASAGLAAPRPAWIQRLEAQELTLSRESAWHECVGDGAYAVDVENICSGPDLPLSMARQKNARLGGLRSLATSETSSRMYKLSGVLGQAQAGDGADIVHGAGVVGTSACLGDGAYMWRSSGIYGLGICGPKSRIWHLSGLEARVQLHPQADVVNAYGLYVRPVTGAGNNYAIKTHQGTVAIGGEISIQGEPGYSGWVRMVAMRPVSLRFNQGLLVEVRR